MGKMSKQKKKKKKNFKICTMSDHFFWTVVDKYIKLWLISTMLKEEKKYTSLNYFWSILKNKN